MKTVALLPNWLGDALMSVPALEALREEGPVVGFGGAAMTELLEGLGAIDGAMTYDRRGRHAGAGGLLRAMRSLRAQRPDRLVCFSPSERAAALVWASGAAERWSSTRPGLLAWASTRSVDGRPDPSAHLADRWYSLVRHRHEVAPPPRLRTPRTWRDRAEPVALREGFVPSDSLFLAPAAAFGPTKEWAVDAYAELVEKLGARFSSTVVIGGSSEREREICGGLVARVGAVDLSGRTTLPELAALLERAGLFVGNDSGPMHLSAALGAPTVGVFTSTAPGWTAPRGERAVGVGGGRVQCAPCFAATCSRNFECLQSVGVDEVARTAGRLLATTPPRRVREKIVWLDRDGTLLDDPGYLKDPDGVRVFRGAAQAVRRWNEAGWTVVLVTNQSGIGRGLMSQEDVAAIHERVRRLLAVEGAYLDHIELCPHAPSEHCGCRKPGVGMIERARRILDVDEDARQVVVGDKPADLGLARGIRATSILVRTGEGRATERGAASLPGEGPDHVVDDLSAAAALVLREFGNS